MVSDALPEPLLADDVEVIYSPAARQTVAVKVSLSKIQDAHGVATVQAAIIASGLCARFPEIDLQTAHIGIWGRQTRLDAPLRLNDRIEIYRPLTVDPKEARRLRYKKQGPVRSRHRPGYKGP
ncbi:Persistence and stress-resistance antitoxin PasI [Saezia sanguinis]|uniref:UPF0125 protein CUZ56_02461 n=1 Tax=Saezia sanguinis TaxID=1965230 RepID=A0A433SAU6_9BURK|nr:RnfH family protein [Saezia sanguinis]RUS65861.1 Persistence and stress-resistance antitoxin PasI [Saezia sanguinis]